MADKTFIYALIDPEKNTVRYIGKSDNPWERLFGRHGHLHDKQKTYKEEN